MFFSDDLEKKLETINEEAAEKVDVTAEENEENCQDCKRLPEIKDAYLHLNADFENYKKRVAKDQQNWVAAGQAQLLLDLLEVVDNFDRAFAEHEKEAHSEKNLDAWLVGFELIRKSLYKFLEKNNVTEIKQVATFDPVLHEAITQIEMDGKESGQIVDVIQRGYKFHDKILRPAKVVVAK